MLLSAASTVDASALTLDRVVATAAALIALAGAVIGGLALARPTTTVSRRSWAALIAGLVGALAGLAILATADGGPGTGNGVVGGYASIPLGLIAAVSGGLALRRSRRPIEFPSK
ncbi:DUF6223 family protein [Actinoplanes solisilvae]|uniref:DUF6223 family protein n=1 Tax=Actinoplanes solisilvae TaxID=2486853 RepID=UPI000FD71A35|nr:DUF6223 family protein [Actinoplanes solisilvae]